MSREITEFEIRTAEIDGRKGVAVVGELDFDKCAELDAALATGTNGDRPTLLDLTECTFIDSKGIESIVRAAMRLADESEGPLTLCNARGQVRQVLRLTKLTDQDGRIVYRDLPR
jgi:anti-sigma B factor antagonist